MTKPDASDDRQRRACLRLERARQTPYTEEQAAFIEKAVAARRPLPAPPVPLDETGGEVGTMSFCSAHQERDPECPRCNIPLDSRGNIGPPIGPWAK